MFTQNASNLISTIGNGNYVTACIERNQLIDLMDETRNANGKSPEMILTSFLFIGESEINVRIWFEYHQPADPVKISLKFIDLMKHMYFNGEATLHNQNKKQVDKGATKESITRGHIIDWLNDIITGRIAYKKTEIALV